MTYEFNIWLDPKNHSVEGHTRTCTLYFKDKVIWGPRSCHPNTDRLKDAIEQADCRFRLDIHTKDHSVEGHIKYISVEHEGKVLLDKMSTHDNMEGLVTAINAVLAVAD